MKVEREGGKSSSDFLRDKEMKGKEK